MVDFDYESWYKSCDFIQDNLQFYSFEDFVKESRAIKRTFNRMPFRTKKLYQWYIFANHLSYNQKTIIWDYLNNYKTYNDLLKVILNGK